MKIIDCTLRDGGYYCNWDFSHAMIKDYLTVMSEIQVDYVELGFRTANKDGFRGACAYTTENFIQNISIPEGLNIGVMLNAKELIPNHNLSELFVPASESKISLVRIACHYTELDKIQPVVDWLNNAGYEVAVNIMQISECSIDLIKELAQQVKDAKALYFADSLGNLNIAQVEKIITALSSVWKGDLGIHAHDNTGRALQNTLYALENGCQWGDCTVMGMGRGAGNTKTEQLIIETDRYTNENIALLSNCIQQHFEPLYQQYKWGANTYYHLAGKHSVHPTYIQKMIDDERYDGSVIVSSIQYLSDIGASKFTVNHMEDSYAGKKVNSTGSWNPAEVIKDRTVLILGSGPSVVDHQEAIENFVKSTKPWVIALNTQSSIKNSLIDLRVACHPFRLSYDCNAYKQLSNKLVVPLSSIAKSVIIQLLDVEIYDYGMSVEQDCFEFNETSAVIPSVFAIGYALAVANSGKAKQIYLAGFDGYSADDPRAFEISQLLNAYNKTSNAIELRSLTPTGYKIPIRSVYSY